MTATENTATELPDPRTALFAAQEWIVDLLGQVRPEQLSGPTPCADFDVRALIAHLLVVQEKVIGFATDFRDIVESDHEDLAEIARLREQEAVNRVDGRTPEQWAQESRQLLEQGRAAWSDAVLTTDIQLGWGPVLPGAAVANIYTMELLTHAWDLASATGQPSEAPGGLGEIGLAVAQRGLPESPRGIEHGVPFGPVVPSAEDAGPTERMANWTGRTSRL